MNNQKNDSTSKNATDNRSPTAELDESIIRSRQSSGGRKSFTGAVANTLWNGASSVSTYVWNFWFPNTEGSQNEPREGDSSTVTATTSTPITTNNSTINSTQQSNSKSKDTNSSTKRESNEMTKKTNVSYLEASDYGIKLFGGKSSNGTLLLTMEIINKIHASLPPRFRLCTNWSLLYGSIAHGFSLSTLFNQSRHHDGPTLTIVRDDGDAVFGVFGTETWMPHFGHYGTGECFLFKIESQNHHHHKQQDSTNVNSKIKRFSSTGKNSYFLLSETNYIAAGCGDGKFGFWLDGELLNGLCQKVPTFDNECLASGERFKCVAIEVWGLDMSSSLK